jgi:hypothetical protein
MMAKYATYCGSVALSEQRRVSMGGLLGLVVLVLDIIAIIDLFKSIKDVGKKVLWLILILVLPVIGMVLYFLIGKKKA